MTEDNKWKARWLVGLVAMGWVFMLFVPTEDGLPPSRMDWILWLIVNVFALVRVHLWLSADVRAERRAMYNRRHHGRR